MPHRAVASFKNITSDRTVYDWPGKGPVLSRMTIREPTRRCAPVVVLAGVVVVGACAQAPPSDAAAASGSLVCGAAELVAPGTISTDRSEVRLAIAPDGSRRLWGAIGWQGGAGGFDIWEQRRGDDGGWLAPAPVSFNSSANDFDPAFAPDGGGVYFFSNRAGGRGGDDLYFAPLDGATGTYGAPRNLGPTVNTPGNEWAPSISPDGEMLLFSSDGRGGRGKQDLFLARRSGADWGDVEPVSDANGPADDFDATFLPDGESIVFAVGDAQSERSELYVSERRDGRFGAPRRLGSSVNAPATLNFGPSISGADAGVLFFSSHRAERTRGRIDIYRIELCAS